jgi:hypothetical protein
MNFSNPRAWTGLAAVAPQPGTEEIRKQLDDILSRPEFSPQRTSWLKSFGDWLANLFRGMGDLSQTAPLLYWALLLGSIVLLVLVLGHIAWTAKRAVFVGRRSSGTAQEQRSYLSLTYRQDAQRWAAEGHFTEAIRCLFLSLIYRFDESGRVNYQQA